MRSMTRAKETRKPMIHHLGVRRESTIELILSVTEAKSCPGPRIGAFAICCTSLSLGLSAMFHSALNAALNAALSGRRLLHLRVRVAQLGKIRCPWPRVQLFQ